MNHQDVNRLRLVLIDIEKKIDELKARTTAGDLLYGYIHAKVIIEQRIKNYGPSKT